MEDINSHNILRLSELIEEAEHPVIVTHMKPDGDAMGSSVALYHFLRRSGKESKIVISNRHPSYLSFLTEGEAGNALVIHDDKPLDAAKTINEADLIFCLDFNAFHRTDALEDALEESRARKVLIDHHLNPDRDRFDLSFSETETSSASELLYHILMSMPSVSGDAGRLPSGCAEALMTGMTTDTNNFANSVYPSTLEMASSLLAAGVDRDRILNFLYNQYSENRLRLMGHMMKDLLTLTEDGVAYIVLDKKTQKEYGISEGDTEGFVNMPLSIGKVRMSLLLKEDGDRVRVSIRSKKGTSANRCAGLHFNGGGHENAAGGRLDMPMDIADISKAAEYIEIHTHEFFKDNERND